MFNPFAPSCLPAQEYHYGSHRSQHLFPKSNLNLNLNLNGETVAAETTSSGSAFQSFTTLLVKECLWAAVLALGLQSFQSWPLVVRFVDSCSSPLSWLECSTWFIQPVESIIVNHMCFREISSWGMPHLSCINFVDNGVIWGADCIYLYDVHLWCK